MVRRRRVPRSERAIARQQVRATRIERKARINDLRRYVLGHAIGVFSASPHQDLNISNEEIRNLLVSSTDEEIAAIRVDLEKMIANMDVECAAEKYMDFIDCVSPDKLTEQEREDGLKAAIDAAFGYTPVGEPVPDLEGATTIDPTSRTLTPPQGLSFIEDDLDPAGDRITYDNADVILGDETTDPISQPPRE